MLRLMVAGLLGSFSAMGTAVAAAGGWGSVDWSSLNWDTIATSPVAAMLDPGDVQGRKDADSYRFRGERSAKLEIGGVLMDAALERNLDDSHRFRFRITSTTANACGAFSKWADSRFSGRVDVDKSLSWEGFYLGMVQNQWSAGNSRISLTCLTTKGTRNATAMSGLIERTSDAVELFTIPTVHCMSGDPDSRFEFTSRIDENSHRLLRLNNTEIEGSYVDKLSARLTIASGDKPNGTTLTIDRISGRYSLTSKDGRSLDSGKCTKVDLSNRAF